MIVTSCNSLGWHSGGQLLQKKKFSLNIDTKSKSATLCSCSSLVLSYYYLFKQINNLSVFKYRFLFTRAFWIVLWVKKVIFTLSNSSVLGLWNQRNSIASDQVILPLVKLQFEITGDTLILVNNENEYEFSIKLSQLEGISWMVTMALRVIFHSIFFLIY